MTTDALKSDGCPWGRCVRAAGHTGGCMASNGDLLSRQFSEFKRSMQTELNAAVEGARQELLDCAHVVSVDGCASCERRRVDRMAAGFPVCGHTLEGTCPKCTRHAEPEPSYTLVGAELVAYSRLRAAALQAHTAQQAAAAAGQALREAMQAWGAVVAPGKEP